MSKYVLDASAVLALLDAEPGADKVAAVLMDAAIGTVNLAEVHTKLADEGVPGARLWPRYFPSWKRSSPLRKNTQPSPAA